MKNKRYIILLISIVGSSFCYSQDYGNYRTIESNLLLRDIEILHQALDKYHTGMYWYSKKDSVAFAFQEAKKAIKDDMNILQFHKIVAPLVSLSREDHTNVELPIEISERLNQEAKFLPLVVTFLGEECYVIQNGSDSNNIQGGQKITKINGQRVEDMVNQVGSLFPSDGYIERVKYSDLRGFEFAKFHYYYFGNKSKFTIEIDDKSIEISALNFGQIKENLNERYKNEPIPYQNKESLEFNIINDSTAYLGLHSFSNSVIKENEVNNKLGSFLEQSFKSVSEKNIQNLIIDLSENGGGNEGNENLVYSYLGNNYKKYKRVRAKTQKAVLDNGTDKPIKLKTFGFFERIFANKKMNDGSYERKENFGFGLMAYKKEPKYKFDGELYVLISPVTYSGGSELANMIHTNNLATFIGEESGGGYYGNTSGISEELTLPHSKIKIDIPSLQFEMNVNKSIPFGRGVIPHYEVIQSFEEYLNDDKTALKFTLELIQKKK